MRCSKVTGVTLLSAIVMVTSNGCSLCRKDGSPQPTTEPASPAVQASVVPSGEEPKEDPVHGLWSQRPFLARSALVSVHPSWLTITLIDREARCDSSRLTENDQGLQMTIPTGPDNDFFTERDMPIEVRLHGAGGVSRIPAGHVTAYLHSFNPETDETLRGRLSFRFRTASDPDAPTYAAQGSFDARVCDNRTTQPSIRPLPSDQPMSGHVAGRDVTIRTMLAYLRDDGQGNPIIMLKGYESNVPCHTSRSATPYLFGAELGPGVDGTYFVGKPLPTQWQMQMRRHKFSERSVHAAHGASWMQIDFVDAREGGEVRGSMGADNPDEEPEWGFTLSGRFEAKVCGVERRAW